MARRKRVARAANPISRGNLDQNEPRQTCRTMRRNFQRGWWDRGCVKTGIEAKEKFILSSRKSENSFYLFPPFVPFFPRFSFPLPWSFLHDADVIIKIAKGPSFFFFELEDENPEESVDANLGRNLIFPFWPIENPRLLAIDSLGWDWNSC